MKPLTWKGAAIKLGGTELRGIRETRFEQDFCALGRGTLTFSAPADFETFLKAWRPGVDFEIVQELTHDESEIHLLTYQGCRACGADGLALNFTFISCEHSIKTAARCECGSGSNVRGPGHSDYCRLLEG